jgi:hypothetical protein
VAARVATTGPTPLDAVDFLIPDDEEVPAWHYSTPHVAMTAAEANGVILHADDPRRDEVVIPRKIEPRELRRTRRVPQIVGCR